MQFLPVVVSNAFTIGATARPVDYLAGNGRPEVSDT